MARDLSPPEPKSPYVGLFVLGGPVGYQGEIFGVEDGIALVEWLSWLDGSGTHVGFLPISDLHDATLGWKVFRDHERFLQAGTKHLNKPETE